MSIALHMIVRNEAMHLPACLKSVRGLFDEMIIVDTGSVDETVTIARREGARVVRFAWCDDFSSARNYGLDRVKSRYVMRMDADDRLPRPQLLKMRALINGLDTRPPAVYMMRVRSNDGIGSSYLDEHRIWPARLGIRFRGRVHERIRPEVDARDLPTYLTDVSLEHVGYQHPRAVEGKLRRNLRILEIERREQAARGESPDPFTLFDSGRTYSGLGHHDEAIRDLRAFLAIRDPGYVLASKIAYRQICSSMRAQGRANEAVEVAREALLRYPNDCLLCAWVADTLLAAGEVGMAVEGYRLALDRHDPRECESGMPSDFPARMRVQIARLDACLSSSPTADPISSSP